MDLDAEYVMVSIPIARYHAMRSMLPQFRDREYQRICHQHFGRRYEASIRVIRAGSNVEAAAVGCSIPRPPSGEVSRSEEERLNQELADAFRRANEVEENMRIKRERLGRNNSLDRRTTKDSTPTFRQGRSSGASAQ